MKDKEKCKNAMYIISQYMFTDNEYTPALDEAVGAIEFIDELVDEYFKMDEELKELRTSALDTFLFGKFYYDEYYYKCILPTAMENLEKNIMYLKEQLKEKEGKDENN